MAAEFGMSDDLGPLGAVELSIGPRGEPPGPPSPATTAAMRALVDEATELANRVLVENRDLLDRVVEALLERESLTGPELEELASAAGLPASGNGTSRPPPGPAKAGRGRGEAPARRRS